MKIILFLVVAILLLVGWMCYVFYSHVQISKALVKAAVPFVLEREGTPSLLVLGDSTGVGVGATNAEETVAGRLATHIGATVVENYSVSGAVVADVQEQRAHAKLGSYSVILLQIGANDIIRFHDSECVGNELAQVLKALPPADQVYVMSAGNVGAATLFPFFVRPFHSALNKKYHKLFTRIVVASGGQYINLDTPAERDPFVLEPEKYFSADGLHPSSEGYRVWFERLLTVIK